MRFEGLLRGKYISMRSVCADDAAFIVDIRNDGSKNAYIHATSKDLGNQVSWIESQIGRDGDYYFVMLDSNQKRVGLASVYNVDKRERTAEFGRWVSRGGTMDNVESVVLLFDFAFSELDLDTLTMLTMVENHVVRSFWETFGATAGELVERDGLALERAVVRRDDYFGNIRDRVTRLLRY